MWTAGNLGARYLTMVSDAAKQPMAAVTIRMLPLAARTDESLPIRGMFMCVEKDDG